MRPWSFPGITYDLGSDTDIGALRGLRGFDIGSCAKHVTCVDLLSPGGVHWITAKEIKIEYVKNEAEKQTRKERLKNKRN